MDIFAVNKPTGMTSHDVVDRVRRITGEKRVGHAGTLDPLAEGVLVIGVGREATKKLSEVVAKEKEYIVTIKLGMTSTTDDEEGNKVRTWRPGRQVIEKQDIVKVLQLFVGRIEQTPPVYSAVKVKGKEAYKRARKGEVIQLEPRSIEIKSIETLKYKWPLLELRVVTGPGVYIRSLARDIGEKLGVGAYLAGLIRTRVGEYRLEDAMSYDTLDILLK